MFKSFCVFALLVAVTLAEPRPKPGFAPVVAAYTAPIVAPAVVTAQSSQVVSRNYNGIVAPIAPVVAAAPIVRAPLVTAPVAYAAAPAAHYHYSPYVAHPSLYL